MFVNIGVNAVNKKKKCINSLNNMALSTTVKKYFKRSKNLAVNQMFSRDLFNMWYLSQITILSNERYNYFSLPVQNRL